MVGSGQELRCGRLGSTIDAYDAVFRANTAQQLDNPDRPVAPVESVGARTTFRVNCLIHASAAARVPQDLQAELRRQFVSPFAASASAASAAAGTASNASDGVFLAGLKSTPTVQLPSVAANETCLIPPKWWAQAWGWESSSSSGGAGGDPAARRAYNRAQLYDGGQRAAYPAPLLAALVAANRSVHGFAFVQRPSHETPGALRSGSGGTAVLAALALCKSIDLYGFGVFTTGLAEDKVYGHYYDGVGAAPRCSEVGNLSRHGIALGDRKLWPKARGASCNLI